MGLARQLQARRLRVVRYDSSFSLRSRGSLAYLSLFTGANSVHAVVAFSSSSRVDLRCRCRQPDGCTFRLTCSSRRGNLVVTQTETAHSCGKENEPANQKYAREQMGLQCERLKLAAQVGRVAEDEDDESGGEGASFQESESSEDELEGTVSASREAAGGNAETKLGRPRALICSKVGSLTPKINQLAQVRYTTIKSSSRTH